jgi:hypothetical protein
MISICILAYRAERKLDEATLGEFTNKTSPSSKTYGEVNLNVVAMMLTPAAAIISLFALYYTF